MEQMKQNQAEMFVDIPGFENWEDVKEINKGWSDDKKYLIHTKNGEKRLLRTYSIEGYECKKKEYEIIKKYAKLGFPMSMPISFGTCNQGKNVYMLLSWVEGEDLEETLPKLSKKEQYELGRSAGRILKAIHSIAVEEEDKPKQTKREKKLLQLQRYEESDLRVPDDENAIAYVKNNIHKIWSKPAVYQHGDFHPGNLIYMPSGKIGVIDFNRWEVGDPYEEFYKVESFATGLSIPYCVGQIDAYFDDNVPEEFWEVLAVYSAQAALFSIKWAEKFGQADIDNMTAVCLATMEHFDNFKRCKPLWYDETMKF